MGSPKLPAHINSDTKRQLCKRCFAFTAVVAVLVIAGETEVARKAGETEVARKAQTYMDFQMQSVYPRGDCVTECSADPAQFMAHCQADPATGIPSTVCKAAAGDFDCPSLRYPDAV